MDNYSIATFVINFLSSEDIDKNVHIDEISSLEYENKIFDFLYFFKLIPFFYWKMSSSNSLTHSFSLQFKSKLSKYFRESAGLYLKRESELIKISNLFASADIKFILLKGAYLSKNLYPHPAIRPMNDIDILLTLDDLNAAIKLFSDAGYTTHLKSSFKPEDFYLKHLPTFTGYKKIPVEIHWSPFSHLYQLNGRYREDVWLRSYSNFSFNNLSYRLDTIDLILTLIIHISENNFKQMVLQLFDIYFIFKKNDVNFNELFERAKLWKVEKPLAASIYLLKEYFNLNFEPIVIEKIEASELSESIKNSLCKTFLNCSMDSTTEKDKFLTFIFRRTLREKIKYFVNMRSEKRNFVSYYKIKKGTFADKLWLLLKVYDIFIKYSKIYFLMKTKRVNMNALDSYNDIQSWLNKPMVNNYEQNLSDI